MKTRNYITAIASLILVSMMWFSCEKENTLPINSATETLDMPAEVAAYLSEREINEFYKEVETAKEALPPLYMVRIVGIVMDNKVEYLLHKDLPFQSPAQIKFTGIGVWKKLGKIRYTETVNLPDQKVKPIGEGIIFLLMPFDYKNNPNPITEVQLEFESSLRKEAKSDIPFPNEVKNQNRSSAHKFYSRIDFIGGNGIFKGAYGIARKLEVHYPERPNYCKGVIYGYVITKVPKA